MTIHALPDASLYTLEILDRDKYWTICHRIEWRKQKVVLNGVKVSESSFAISRVNYVNKIHIVGQR